MCCDPRRQVTLSVHLLSTITLKQVVFSVSGMMISMSDHPAVGSVQIHGDGDPVNVPGHVWKYAQDQSDLADAARDIKRYLEGLAERGSIPIYTIEARAKSLTSYQDKASKCKADGAPKYSDPATQIHDCVAARVIVFTTRARDDLAELIELHAEVIEHQNPGHTKHNGYDSEHLVIANLTTGDELARHAALGRYFTKYRGLEIQIRSVAGHAWAEYEHDVRYKSGAYQELSDDGKLQINQWFVEAGGMRRVMDDLFGMIESRLITVEAEELTSDNASEAGEGSDEGFDEDSDPRELDPATLSELITQRFPNQELGDSATVSQLLSHLSELSVTTVGNLEAVLANVEAGHVARLMDYPSETSGVRRLDDELLASFTERYVEAATGEERKQFLRLRLRRVRGKFAIYSIDNNSSTSKRLITAAKAVRELASIVATSKGAAAASIDGAIASEKHELLPSTNARMVKTANGPVYVATNFTRSWAESVMCGLVERIPGSNLRVYRAGDLLVEAPVPAAGTSHEFTS